MHWIGHDNGTFQIQSLQQFLNGRNLVRLFGDADLPAAEVHVIGPNVDHMQWLLCRGIVMAASQRLAINCDRLTDMAELQMFDPRRQMLLQLFSVKNTKHATKLVVRRDAISQMAVRETARTSADELYKTVRCRPMHSSRRLCRKARVPPFQSANDCCGCAHG